LLIEYAKRSVSPISDAIDARLRMTPPPPRSIIGRPACEQRCTPFHVDRVDPVEVSFGR
jgi:hypothetical protein